MTYNQQAAIRALRGAQNRNKGKAFEEYINKACLNYKDKHIAFIEKTPEPFHITKSLGNGRFEGNFSKSAQPDYKGTLAGGTTICFDAKATDTEKIPVSALSDEQVDSLAEHTFLGAVTGVLLCFSFRTFAFIPFGTFMRAKELNGHKHWTEKDAEPYRVYMNGGYLDFLENKAVRAVTLKETVEKLMYGG